MGKADIFLAANTDHFLKTSAAKSIVAELKAPIQSRIHSLKTHWPKHKYKQLHQSQCIRHT